MLVRRTLRLKKKRSETYPEYLIRTADEVDKTLRRLEVPYLTECWLARHHQWAGKACRSLWENGEPMPVRSIISARSEEWWAATFLQLRRNVSSANYHEYREFRPRDMGPHPRSWETILSEVLGANWRELALHEKEWDRGKATFVRKASSIDAAGASGDRRQQEPRSWASGGRGESHADAHGAGQGVDSISQRNRQACQNPLCGGQGAAGGGIMLAAVVFLFVGLPCQLSRSSVTTRARQR